MDAGGGDGWLHPNWWRPVGYSSSSSRGSSSYTSTPGTTSTPSPSPYTNLTPSPQSSRRLDLMSCQHSEKEPEYIKCFLQGVAKGDVSISTLETVLGVGRQIADDASAMSLLHFTGFWIRALVGITESVLAPYCLELVGDGAPAPAEKLRPLIDVREAVSRASQDIRLSFCATSSQEAKRITDGVTNLLLAKGSKLDEAIWSTMEETSARLVASTDMEDDEDITW
nr:unnamed protein product [Digitaria exilis]